MREAESPRPYLKKVTDEQIEDEFTNYPSDQLAKFTDFFSPSSEVRALIKKASGHDVYEEFIQELSGDFTIWGRYLES